VANYLKQSAVDYRSHLTIENNLKVEKKYVTAFRKQAQLSLPPKNTWCTRGDKHQKLQSNNYSGTLPWKVFIASQGH